MLKINVSFGKETFKYVIYGSFSIISLLELQNEDVVSEIDIFLTLLGTLVSIFVFKIISNFLAASSINQNIGLLGLFIPLIGPTIFLLISYLTSITTLATVQFAEYSIYLTIYIINYLYLKEVKTKLKAALWSVLSVLFLIAYTIGINLLQHTD
jgi:hypothetical protein